MSVAGLRCPGCGSANVVEDELYCQAQLVCVDCGSVVSEGTLASDPVGGSALYLSTTKKALNDAALHKVWTKRKGKCHDDVSYQRTTAVARKPCVNLIKGVQRMKAMCRTLRVRHEIEELAESYYTRAYTHQTFIKVSLLKKEALAGCCVLVSCRQRNWPLTIGTISCLLDADPKVVGGVYQEMLKILSIEAPIVSVTDVIASHVQEYKLGSLDVPEELAEESRDLTKRAVTLVELAADTWIVTGRKPVPIMMAAVYLAWQSLKPSKQRLRLSLDKFCQLAKVNKQKPAVKRIAEMKEVLCKLGREIPWLQEQPSPDNVVVQVEDIVKHRYALLRKAMRAHEVALLAACPSSCKDPPPAETASSQTSQLQQPTSNAPGAEHHVANGVKAERRGEEDDDERKVNKLHSDIQEGEDSSGSWGKRALFAPPCVIHPKRRRVEELPQRQDVTGYEEIEDSEIDSYIRTPREVRDLIRTHKMFSEKS